MKLVTLHNSSEFGHGHDEHSPDDLNQVTSGPIDRPYEDWFSQGKSDAWSGAPKNSPEHDPQAASFYDLGYDEGIIQKSPLKN